MGNMDGRLGNGTPTTSWHQLHWWKSPRWIVIRIEALAVVAIIISFFLAAFGSCRRWSNSWIVQKGFLVAQVLSLSLGTYSIGLMQSSSVKSEMYPIWTVSLFTLFGCIDPVTTYNGLDYKGPLSKVVYGICLNCGYVLLMSISTISNVVGNAAIITLSAITFVKGFHRSFALVQQNRMRDPVSFLDDMLGEADTFKKDERRPIIIHLEPNTNPVDIEASIRNNKDKQLQSCYDVCVALSLSQKLQPYFVGLGSRVSRPETLKGIDYEWALKVIEIELAFVFDVLFTGNPFLHYYQVKTASLWAMASLAGVCFVLVATAIPGGMTRRPGASGYTEVVGTTTADLAITFGILVSLALLQLMQLVRSWTSNWARVAVACAYARKDGGDFRSIQHSRTTYKMSGWMRLKVFVATSTNLFDKYLWQDKISQYSLLPEPRLLIGGETCGRCGDLVQMLGLHYIWQVIWELFSSNTNNGVNLDEDVEASIPERISPSEIEGEGISPSEIEAQRISPSSEIEGEGIWSSETEGERISPSSETEDERMWSSKTIGEWIRRRCVHLVETLGLHYIWQVIWELLSRDGNKRGGVKLDEDVKASIADFLGQIQSDRLDRNWLSSLPEEPQIRHFLPHFNDPLFLTKPELNCYRYTSCVMTWHIVTWYCELAEQKRQEDALMSRRGSYSYLRKAAAAIPRPGNCFQRRAGEGRKTRDHRRVANALSMYCVYLVKSAPELLPGKASWTKSVYNYFADEAKQTGIEACDKDTILANMSDHMVCQDWYEKDPVRVLTPNHPMQNGQALAKLLMRRPDEIWKTLALVWVQLLVYAAPYGNVEAHMRRLSQGGEFITHLWALFYHLGIRGWKPEGNLIKITTMDYAQRILTEDDQAVVAYLPSDYGSKHDEVATASRLEDGVRYYYTSDSLVAELFRIERNKRPDLAFMKNEANNHKPTFYDGEFSAYDIARFVTENKIALPHGQAQAQSSEDDGGQSETRIEEEIQPNPWSLLLGRCTPTLFDI